MDCSVLSDGINGLIGIVGVIIGLSYQSFSKKREEKNKIRKELTELCVRVLLVRYLNRVGVELHKLREFALSHPEFIMKDFEFFNKWLNDPIVIDGKDICGYWTAEKFEDIQADIAEIKYALSLCDVSKRKLSKIRTWFKQKATLTG